MGRNEFIFFVVLCQCGLRDACTLSLSLPSSSAVLDIMPDGVEIRTGWDWIWFRLGLDIVPVDD